MEKKPTGSFGIPAELKQKLEKKPEEKAPELKAEVAPTITDETVTEVDNANKIFEALGVKFTDDHFQQMIFTGSFDMEVPIIKDRFNVVFSMLKAKDYDLIDEIIAEEADTLKMTMNGLEIRKQNLTISAAISKIGAPKQMKALAKPKTEKPTDKEILLEKRKAIVEMAPAVVNMITQKHAALSMAVSLVVKEPGDFAKNS